MPHASMKNTASWGASRRFGKTAAVALLVVRGGGVEVLIPFVESMIVEVDRERRILRLRLPEGLLEACASPY